MVTQGHPEWLTRHTGGHPLFTIELLNDMKERGDLKRNENGRWVEGDSLSWNTLPARVEGVIGRRIERLDGTLRHILTVASVEGKEFTAEVVARVQEVNERELVRQLSSKLDRQHRLVKEQGLLQLNKQRLSRYLFRHNLFQKYLYYALGEVELAYLHEAVGKALEMLYEDQKEEIAFRLAHHFIEGGVTEKAVAYLLLAGQNAIRLSANKEAIIHLREGLRLLKALPTSAQRIRQELTLLLALGVPVSATKGYAAPELEEIYTQARNLAQQVGRISQLFQALHGLGRYYGLQGIEQIREGLERWGHVRIKINRSPFLALLAEAYQLDGQIEAALTTLDEALTVAQQTGESWWDAELYRLKGELLIQANAQPDDAVEAYFHQAIEFAHQQQAKLLELRAVMSLCRLWQNHGKTGEARQMLAEIYHWFTEGFETADLKEAKALLTTLSVPAD
jgi:predicted ATPase